jgi:GDP/UDP-N,N'-diacetylbacillosamine 2-epimerase (hydrolysing)
MKVAVLTSSRADYSIYLPLLNLIKSDSFFDLSIIAFGTHLSERHGYTINQILNDGFEVEHRITAIPLSDYPRAISDSMAQTILGLNEVWEKNSFDLVISLGDRSEMFAACASALPFNLPIAHIHGGEETTGAIDNVFRHSISHMSKYHFVSTDIYRNRVIQLCGKPENVFNVGALSIDNFKSLKFYNTDEFKERFNIDLTIPSILITFHPETVSFERNHKYMDELIGALSEETNYQYIITMPNTDTMGNMIRGRLIEFSKTNNRTVCIENFGTIGYLSCMKFASFMLGNTSSGFVEAAFFPKYVVNLGVRQNGRIITPNIHTCEIEKLSILNAIKAFESIRFDTDVNIYGDGNTAKIIVSILKDKI